ncbi:hypothetical protein TWF173_002647 [Orbilia oligospora]|nr:hypothetical protein TWF173_002647 [Orbilia oligospora]
MHFTTILATSAAVGGALAGVYQEEPVYYTSAEQVYTSIKTCTDKPVAPTTDSVYVPTSEPVYGGEEPTTEAPVYNPEPTGYGPSEVTYTSYDVITVTSCAGYVTDCPAATYTSPVYSVSTCTDYPVPTGGYEVPSNNTATYEVPPPTYETETPEYPTSVPVYENPSTTDVYTHTYYTTVCPGKDYCYATTVTSTYCPGKPTEVPSYTKPVEVPSYTKPVEVPSYTKPPVDTPTYTPPTPHCPGGKDCPPAPSCPGGDYCPPTPPKNETETPTYTPPPSYTGAASTNFVSFGVAAVAGLAALFIAA